MSKKMELKVDSVDVRPSSYDYVDCTIEVDEDQVLGHFGTKEIIDIIGESVILDEIKSYDVVDHYGDILLSHFSVSNILEHFPIEDFIEYLGEDVFRTHLRDIYIDDILKKSP